MFLSATVSGTTWLMSQARIQLPKMRSALLLSSRPLSKSNDDEETISANYQDIPNKEPYVPPPPEPFASVWGEKPPCCINECTNYRHDILFLKSTPLKRYTRTWVEPEPVKAKKKVCGPIMEPERHIRKLSSLRAARNPGASTEPCKGDQSRQGLMECVPPPKVNDPCARIRMPGCNLPRIPPKCVVSVKESCCQKRCTLYPSYSECNMPKPPVKAPTECTCNKVPSKCEVFAMFRKFPVK